MKQVIIVILISVMFPGIISQGIPGKVHSMEITRSGNSSNAETDTIKTNPYLKIRRFEIDILTPSSGIQLYNNGILFLSLSKRDAKMISKHISFGDKELYYASLNDSVLGEEIPFYINPQLMIPADGITFTSNLSRFYYSKLSEQDGKVKIYMAESDKTNSDQPWAVQNKLLGFCEDNNYTHPTISPDGDVMIFSSDMPGGIGGLDLYISRYENNMWTAPENMGKKFNSAGSELYACLDHNNNLYFSSDGLQGFGGYDIFFSNFNSSDWDDPVNLYDQLNTDNDEVAFKINREGKNYGFYTMIERSGIGKKRINRKLYKIELDEKYKNDNAFLLSDILRDYATGSPMLTMQKAAEDLEAVSKPEENRIADSLRIEELEAERLAAEKLAEEKLEAERHAEEKRIADSLRIEELKKEEADAAEDKVIYRVQILSSTKEGGTYNISVNGTKYDTWEYYYKGAWRVTVGEFAKLSDARELQNKCRNSGYDQAFVVALINNERSLDVNLFKR